MPHYLAVDLGAESGRVMLATLERGRLELEELHRFANAPVQLPTGLYWDSFRLFHDIVRGLSVAGRERKLKVAGIGIDTWGVDFGLLGADGSLVDCPRHYRDPRNDGIPERLFETVPRGDVFAHTGIQFMQFNSIYQLYAMKLGGCPGLGVAERLLFMPDLLSYWLTGVQKSEASIASTSQFYDPRKKRFATELFERLGLPTSILPPLVETGTLLGPLREELAESTKLGPAPVYATAAHDTASAVAAVPASGDRWCYISSGTWSLMGVELDEPVITDRSLELNFTNEIGAGGKVRFLKNIAGLWLLQECRRAWAAEGREYSYEELARLAAEAGPSNGTLDVDAFLHPGQMPLKIAAWRRAHSQPVPETPGEVCRAILEGLAARYAEVLESLDEIVGHRIETIHIVGGGSRHRLLNSLVAEATGRRVIAGPTEATAIGNVLVQAVAAGQLRDLAEGREIVRGAFELEIFDPPAA
ncbi:MAG: rhamnulokinase [Acidobacteria bacterium]|nr:rhamnulokinase [Acidobacteriota bacterium]